MDFARHRPMFATVTSAVELYIIIMIYDHHRKKDRFFLFYGKRLFSASHTIVYREFNSFRHRARVQRKRIKRTRDISTVQTKFRNAFRTSDYHMNGCIMFFYRTKNEYGDVFISMQIKIVPANPLRSLLFVGNKTNIYIWIYFIRISKSS